MKDQYLQVMISIDEKRMFDAAAEREHLTLSEWLRWILVKAAQAGTLRAYVKLLKRNRRTP